MKNGKPVLDERKRKILAIAKKHTDNPLVLGVIEWANFIAQETLADRITFNGVVIYDAGDKSNANKKDNQPL